MIKVINPQGQRPAVRKIPMATRLDSMNDKTIFIVNVRWPYTSQFSQEMYEFLSEKFPSTKFILRDKIGSYFDDDPDLWNEIKENGHAAIIEVGH
jgi:hypothetical protein